MGRQYGSSYAGLRTYDMAAGWSVYQRCRHALERQNCKRRCSELGPEGTYPPMIDNFDLGLISNRQSLTGSLFVQTILVELICGAISMAESGVHRIARR